jgi:cell wall-associated NlpC family hydrolase
VTLAIVAAFSAIALGFGMSGQAAAAVPTTKGTYSWPTADAAHVKALNAAYSMIGTPYLAGGTTPAGFDCSGFTRWSFARAGISLPRDSRSQQSATLKIGAEAARPGDLVFWGSPVYHVGIYVGDDMVIHSPSSGRGVNVIPIRWMGTPSSYGRVK